MAKKNSRDLFKQMNSNVSILEETDKSPILNTEMESSAKSEKYISTVEHKEITEKKQKEEQVLQKREEKLAEKATVFERKDSLEKADNNLIRITYNLTYDLNEKFNSFTKQYELYKTSLIKALMEGWIDGSIEIDESEVLFNDGLVKIKKKAGSRKAVGSILIPEELDKAFTKKCHELGIERNNCIFRLLKNYLEQKGSENKV